MQTARHTILALCLLAAACAAPSSGVDRSDPHGVQAVAAGDARCVVTSETSNRVGAEATNIARARAGLPGVRPNAVLARAAAEHACDMAKRGRMTHNGSSSSGPGARVKALGYRPMLTAENIAAGPFDLNRALHEWNSSSKHLDNVLIPQMRDFGIGHAIGSDGKTHFWAAVYSAPR
ncbi:CAP domain-containing protein [Paracoccus onubensis]|uniref:CAP domain-containing protein n=2 Tax=Paracoccus onubensis TaxID=1675788 RepID=A0A418SVT9_9RHOB|nr:CAP domain-containing protein [Paracoccus onubensis]